MLFSGPASFEYHRIIEWFELEGTLKGHLVQLPCNEQEHLKLHQGAQNPIQPDPEFLQGWGTHHLRGQPVPAPHHPYCKKKLGEGAVLRIHDHTSCVFKHLPNPFTYHRPFVAAYRGCALGHMTLHG